MADTQTSTETANPAGPRGGSAARHVSLLEVLRAGLAAHQRGDLTAAEDAYRLVLRHQPKNADALQYLGVIAHSRGDDEQAVRFLEKALKAAPRNGTAHNNLGSILMRMGDSRRAERHYRKALGCPDAPPDALCNLGILQRNAGKRSAARKTLEDAVAHYPDFPKAKRELAELLTMEQDFARAEPLLRSYLEAVPDDARARTCLGLALQTLGRLEEAQQYFLNDGDGAAAMAGGEPLFARLLGDDAPSEETWREIADFVRRNPDRIADLVGTGINLVQSGRTGSGLRLLHAVAEWHPENVNALNDIGALLSGIGKKTEGISFLSKAAELDPDNADIFNNLGNIYVDIHRSRQAVPHLQRAIALQPDLLEAHVALCRAYRALNDFDKASLFARATLALPTYNPRYFSTLLQIFRATCDFDAIEQLGDLWENCAALTDPQLHSLFLGYLVETESEEDARRLLGLIRRWARHAEAQAAGAPLAATRPRAPRETLRVGILSSDLRSHSVARFALPLVEGFDREALEIYCYTPFRAPGDAVQSRFRDGATAFRLLENMTHKEIAEHIRGDGIDILIELNGFTYGSCLPVLAYRPAPVQMAWIGYPFTTGLEAVDYVLMDRFVKPADESLLAEEPVVMPEAWLCFREFPDTPVAAELPMDREGRVTFGSLNNTYKITRDVIALWSRVMSRVPGSRFLLVRPEVSCKALVRNVAHEFERHGIDAERLYFFDNQAQKTDHLLAYNEIDISLDTFPVTGGTTTCEALWMGVPVVSLVGGNFHQRVSYSMLMQCGLEELCAFSKDDYEDAAVGLADDPERLRRWRQGLRDIVGGSPLCDDARFVFQFQEMLLQVADLHKLRP